LRMKTSNMRNKAIRGVLSQLYVVCVAIVFWYIPLPGARYPDVHWQVNDAANRLSAVCGEYVARLFGDFPVEAEGADLWFYGTDANAVLAYHCDNIAALAVCGLAFLMLYLLLFGAKGRRMKGAVRETVIAFTVFFSCFVVRACVFGWILAVSGSVDFVPHWDTPIRSVMLVLPWLASVGRNIWRGW